VLSSNPLLIQDATTLAVNLVSILAAEEGCGLTYGRRCLGTEPLLSDSLVLKTKRKQSMSSDNSLLEIFKSMKRHHEGLRDNLERMKGLGGDIKSPDGTDINDRISREQMAVDNLDRNIAKLEGNKIG
jgi:hypothetical protein